MRGVLSFLMCLCLSSMVFAEQEQKAVSVTQEANLVNWHTHYDDAIAEARELSRPVFILFTGSDWCSWCQKFEKEVLSQTNFQQEVQDSFVFLKVDFRIDLKDNKELFAEYQTLKSRFGARGFPSVVIVNSEEEIMGVTGYLSGGASGYAKHISSLIDEYKVYMDKIEGEAINQATSQELQELYQRAKELSREEHQARILEQGVKLKENDFFLAESYKKLVEAGNYDSSEALAVRTQLLDSSKKNHIDNARFVAIVDFQEALEKGNSAKAIEPLMAFLDKYASQDAENAWKVQMVVSQYYSDHDAFGEALEYAELALKTAPEGIKEDIAEAVRFLKSETELR